MLSDKDSARFKSLFPEFAKRLSPQGVNKLLKHCTIAEFKAGRNLVRDKMPTDALFFVLEGDATIFLEEEEKTITLGRITPGQLLGEVSILSRRLISSSTVQALSNMTTLRLKHQPLENLLTAEDTGPVLLELLAEILAERLRVHRQQ